MTAEIFVLNYNGSDLLVECLPSLIQAARNSGCLLTVIDNSSTDNSLEILNKQFPQARVVVSPNRVLCSFNEAVKKSSADVVLLLNNDLKVDANFLQPLIQVFERYPNAFLAAPKAFTFDGAQYEGSLSKMSFRAGLLKSESRFPGYEAKIDIAGPTMQAGFGAFRRSIFLELGGFDDLYLPGTVEDCDLCFRAWKAGYAGYYEPKSLVFHKGQATFKKNFSRSRLLAINQRNLYLFMWKNITSPVLWFWHLVWLAPRPLYFLLKGRYEFMWGFFWALGRLPKSIVKRFSHSGKKVLSDRQIFELSEVI